MRCFVVGFAIRSTESIDFELRGFIFDDMPTHAHIKDWLAVDNKCKPEYIGIMSISELSEDDYVTFMGVK